MPTYTLEVLGMPEVERVLNALPAIIQGRVLRPALRDGAKVIRDAVVDEAPRFTGNMARHFKVRAMKIRRRFGVGMRVIAGTKDDLGIPERTKAGGPRGFYPIAIEYGWHPGLRPGTRKITFTRARTSRYGAAGTTATIYKRLTDAEYGTKKVQPNPFMLRAFQGAREAALEAVKAGLRAGVEALNAKPMTASDTTAAMAEAA